MTKTIWTADLTHSELSFKIKHLMITNVKGNFKQFELRIETEGDDFSMAKVHLTADMASIHTNNEQRDEHLKAGDFFDISNYPNLSFSSSSMKRTADDSFELVGDLSIKGITRPVTLQVDFHGLITDPWGGERAGFHVSGKISRSDWGINFNSALETGGLMLGEEVKISSEIQVIRQAELIPA